MTPQSNYEQARDEAAEKSFNEKYNDNTIMENGTYLDGFKEGSDFGRSYEQKLNADLLADNKLMKEALEYVIEHSMPDTYNNEKAKTVMSQLKGKYDE